MDLEADLKWIHDELDTIKDPTFLEAIKSMLKYRNKVATERASLAQYNEEINASIDQIKAGKTFSQQEMKDRIKQWSE